MAQIDDIISKVTTLTDRQKIQWTAVGTTGFRPEIDNLHIAISRDTSGSPFYNFTVYGEDAQILEQSGDYGMDSLHGHLYELARRNALKVDDNLKRLSQRLDELI